MLLINCPYCGEERPELEFRNTGEAHIARPANIAEVDDEAFEAFLYLRTNPKGIVYERWRHVHGCGRFFNAVRDTVMGRCSMCHAAEPAWEGIHMAPKSVRLDTDETIAAHAREIYLQAGRSHAMPPGNLTGVTPDERALIVAWFEEARGN